LTSCGGDTAGPETGEGTETGGAPDANGGKEGSSGTGTLVRRESFADMPLGTAFAFDLLRNVAKEETEGGNVFISPLSANIALSMLSVGAAGETRQEILQALGYGDLSSEAVNEYIKNLPVFGPEQSGATVEQGNSVWANNAIPLLESFTETLQTFYGADIRKGYFTAEAINRWCAEQTHNRIPQLLDGEAAGDFYLINTLYFKAKWSSPFNPAYTEEEGFAEIGEEGTEAAATTNGIIGFRVYLML
jgi:serpin B